MRFYFFLLVLFISFPSRAVIAYTYPISISTQKGHATIYLRGNEHYKYAVTSDGFPIVKEKDNWFHAFCDEKGNLCKSDFLVEDIAYRSKELKAFLSTIHSEVGIPLKTDYPHSKLMQEKKITGERKVLVILAQFPDKKISHAKEDFQNLFNAVNYSEDGAKGSVYDYFRCVSYNTLNLVCDIIGPFTCKLSMSYYGGNRHLGGEDKNPYALFSEAIEYASTQLNLKDYDSDNDGYIDNIHIIYAGYGEEAGASSDAIWAHEMTFEPVKYQGVNIDRYSCAPELRSNRGNGISRIGPHCHEIGHALGAMDYYDTDYQTGGDFDGTGKWDVMASGSWNEEGISPANFNPYVKAYDFGWCNVTNLTEEGTYTCSPTNLTNDIYRIDTQKEGEFFLLENRQQNEFDASIPGHGLLIYHIDSKIEQSAASNQINARYPQNCYIVCASSGNKHHNSNAKSYGDINSDGCPYPGSSNNHNFNMASTPSALRNDGTFSGVNITDIVEQDGNIIFSFAQDDTPQQSEDIHTGDILIWKDSFDSYFLDSRWHQQPVIGNNQWTRDVSFAGNTINGYLTLSPLLSPLSNGEKVVTRLYLTLDDIENGDYIVSVQLASSGKNINGNIDSLYISTADINKEYLSDRSEFAIDNPQWITHNIKLEKTADTKYLCIEGVCYKGTSLLIDDVTITKQSVTNVNNVYRNKSNSLKRFSINGVIAPHDSKGIYIKNGKKILSSSL